MIREPYIKSWREELEDKIKTVCQDYLANHAQNKQKKVIIAELGQKHGISARTVFRYLAKYRTPKK